MSEATKTCPGCTNEQPTSGFSRDSRRKDGLQVHCKACNTIAYLKHRDTQVKRAAAFKKANPNKAREWQGKWESKVRPTPEYKMKERARGALHRAIAAGVVVKPESCQDCTAVLPKQKIHAHHPDYAKPLSVEWLCAQCHGKKHRRAGQAVAA